MLQKWIQLGNQFALYPVPWVMRFGCCGFLLTKSSSTKVSAWKLLSIQITFLRTNSSYLLIKKRASRWISVPVNFVQNTVWSSNQYSKDLSLYFWIVLQLLENSCVAPRTVFSFLRTVAVISHWVGNFWNLCDFDIADFQIEGFCFVSFGVSWICAAAGVSIFLLKVLLWSVLCLQACNVVGGC